MNTLAKHGPDSAAVKYIYVQWGPSGMQGARCKTGGAGDRLPSSARIELSCAITSEAGHAADLGCLSLSGKALEVGGCWPAI